jgi:hypothetical protein
MLPEEGLAFMAQLVVWDDPDTLWIAKQNLKKNWLVESFPRDVDALSCRLSACPPLEAAVG